MRIRYKLMKMEDPKLAFTFNKEMYDSGQGRPRKLYV